MEAKRVPRVIASHNAKSGNLTRNVSGKSDAERSLGENVEHRLRYELIEVLSKCRYPDLSSKLRALSVYSFLEKKKKEKKILKR